LSGYPGQPVKFSWFTKNLEKEGNLLFRYRLYPEDDWSPWQRDNYVDFYFINKGQHEFQVQCTYAEANLEKTTNLARYSFMLSNPIVARPENLPTEFRPGDKIEFIDKGDVKQTATKASEVVRSVYNKSTILILGVESYADRSFVPLPFVRNDLSAVARTFSAMGFSVKQPPVKTRDEIISAIRSTLVSLEKNDRLVIYVSSHGYVDTHTGRPMLATGDCIKADGGKCISVSEVKDLINTMGGKARHILLILDCCTSGVGVIDKSSALGPLRSLETEKGAHILTAGMGDQNARMDNEFKMSVFTHYLVEGLTNKAADYTKDGIITLTELLIYVQYHVAQRTDSQQIPSWGRIDGFGEIIFL
jgi:Caspase domain